MLLPSLLLFAAGAIGGLVMAMRSLKDQPVPWIITIGHGVLVASGLVLLLLSVLDGAGGTAAQIALAALLIAALGGFYLVSFHLKKTSHPRAGIVVHAVVAVIGVGFLLFALVGS